MKKNYIVCSNWEIYNRKHNNVFCYHYSDQAEDSRFFENINDAKKFIDNYPLQVDKEGNRLYVNYLCLYEYDEKLVDISETEGIDPNEKGELYSKTYNDKEIEEKAGVKLENTVG